MSASDVSAGRRPCIRSRGATLAIVAIIHAAVASAASTASAADASPTDLEVASSLGHLVETYYKAVRAARSTVGMTGVAPVVHLDEEIGSLAPLVGLEVAHKLADSFSAVPLSDSESLWSSVPGTLHRPRLAITALAHELELRQGQILSVAIAVRRETASTLHWQGYLPVGINVIMVDQVVCQRYEDLPDARFAGMTLLLDCDQGTAYVDQSAAARLLAARTARMAGEQRTAGIGHYLADPEMDQVMLANLIACDPARPQDRREDDAFLVAQIAEAMLYLRTLEHCTRDPQLATMSNLVGTQSRVHSLFHEAVAILQQMGRPQGARAVLPWLIAGLNDKPLRSSIYDICLKWLCIELLDNPGRYGVAAHLGKDPRRAALALGSLESTQLSLLASRALVRVVDFIGVSIAARMTGAGQHADLINLLERLRRAYPSAMGCQHAYGMQLIHDGDLQDARLVAYAAVEMDGSAGNRASALDILGRIFDREGQHASAYAVIQQVLELVPGDAAALFALVRHWVEVRDRSQADHALALLASAHPESAFVATAQAMIATAWPSR